MKARTAGREAALPQTATAPAQGPAAAFESDLLGLLFDQNTSGLVLHDYKNNRVLRCNARVLQLFEAGDQNQFAQRFNSSLLAEGHSVEHELNLLRAFSRGQTISQQLHFKSLKGNEFWAQYEARAVKQGGQTLYLHSFVDISRQVQPLSLEAERLRLVIEALPHTAVALVDRQERFTFAGGKLWEMLGLDPQQVRGQNWHKLHPVFNSFELTSLLDQTLNGHVAHACAHWQGAEYALWLVPMPAKPGAPAKVMAVLQDNSLHLGKAIDNVFVDRLAKLVTGQSKVGAYILNLPQLNYRWNDCLFEMLGYAPNEVPAGIESFMARLHPDDYNIIDHLRKTIIDATQTETEVFYRALLPNQQIRYVHCQIFLDRRADGTATLLGLHYDITEKEESKRRLDANRNLLHHLFNDSPDAILLIDEATNCVVQCNDKALELFDAREHNQITGKHQDDFYNGLRAPEDAVTGRGTVTFQLECQSFRGRRFWADISIRRTVIDQTAYRIIRLADISERRRAAGLLYYNEALLKTVFNESPDGLLLLHEEAHAVVRANQRLLDLFEAEDLSQLLAARQNHILEFELNQTQRFSLYQAIMMHQNYQARLQYSTLKGRRIWVDIYVKRLQIGDVNYLLARLRDVTLMVSAEQELLRSEQRYRSLFELNPQPMWLLADQTDLILKANTAALHLYGYNLNESYGLTFAQMTGAPLPPGQADEAGMINHGVVTHVTRSGHRAELQLISGSLTGPSHEAKGRIVIAVDLTAQLQAERKLRTQNEYLDRILENLPNAVFVKTLDGRLVLANRALGEIYDKPLDYLLSKNQAEYLPVEQYEKYAAIDRQVIEQRINYSYEEQRLNHSNGRMGYYMATKVPLELPDGNAHVLCVITDLTERKQFENELQRSQHLFESIFNNSTDALLLIEKQNQHIKVVNEQVLRLFRYENTDMLTGRFEYFLKRHAVEEPLKCPLDELSTEGTLTSMEFEFKTLNNERRFWGSLAHGSFLVGGVPHQIVRISDITGRKELEGQLRNSLTEKEVLIKEIHHRVKNNLAIISGLLHLQSHYFNEPHVQAAFRDSQSRIQGMALIHEQLYQADLLSEIDFGNYMRSLAMQLQGVLTAQKRVDMRLDTQALVLDITKAVPAGLLLNEIITNSFKHAIAHSATPVVTISLKKEEDLVVMTVADNGPGIDPEIFNKPQQSSLGLTLIRELTRQLKGKLRVDGSNGTSISVAFPQ